MVALTKINGQTLESTTALGRVCVAAEVAGVRIERAQIEGHHLVVEILTLDDAMKLDRALALENALINGTGWTVLKSGKFMELQNEHGVVLKLRHGM